MFKEIILLSIMGSFTAIGILFVKKLFSQKISAKFHYCIWFILIVRLVIPFTLPSSISLFNYIPQAQSQINANLWNTAEPELQNIGDTSVSEYNEANYNNVTANVKAVESASLFKGLGFNLKTAALIWSTVLVIILVYIGIVNFTLTLKLRKFSSCARQDIIDLLNLCKSQLKIKSTVIILYDKQIKSPMLCGYLHPKILINSEIIERLSNEELRYVFLHELSHLKRKDLAISLVGMIIQSIYWFNPIILYSVHQMKKDCEIACDASVLSVLNAEENKKYGQTIISILKILSNAGMVPGTLGFTSKYNIRRITMITRFKKTSAKYTVVALMITLLLTGCSSFTSSQSASNSAHKSMTANTKTQNDADTFNATSSTSNSKMAETVASQSIVATQPDIKDSIIYIAGISKSLRGIDRYSLNENGEIFIGSSYVFDTNCRYYYIDQTEISFEEFSTIIYSDYILQNTMAKCNMKSVGRIVVEIHLMK